MGVIVTGKEPKLLRSYANYPLLLCMYGCMYICVYVCACVRVCVLACVCVYVCMYVCMFVHTYVRIVCMYVCVCVCMYVRMQLYGKFLTPFPLWSHGGIWQGFRSQRRQRNFKGRPEGCEVAVTCLT